MNSYAKNSKKEKNTRIPVTVLTGYLGSGKTTMLNYILTQNHGYKIAVVENEFGEVGIDDDLVKQKVSSQDQLIEMKNGCICCTVRGDLIQILGELIKKKDQFDYVIIETTGLADPAPVAQTFFVDEKLAKDYYLDAIITLVDCKHFEQHLDEQKGEGVENEANEQIAFADKVILNKIDLVEKDYIEHLKKRIKAINGNVEIILSEQSVVNLEKILKISAFDLKTVLTLEPDFLENQEHQHDKTISSVGMMFDGPVNKFKLDMLLRKYVGEKGNDLYRYKGVLNIKGSDNRYIFQGIHMLFSSTPAVPWGKSEKRTNKLCFIGKNLNREEIEKDVKDCLDAPDLRFKIGQDVYCNCDGWKKGKIIKTWDECNAYRVRLYEDNVEVWAPVDWDMFIRENKP